MFVLSTLFVGLALLWDQVPYKTLRNTTKLQLISQDLLTTWHYFCTPQQSKKATKMYEIKSVPGKGKGMFAKEDINAGVRILVDRILCAVVDTTIDEGVADRINASINNLSPENREKFEKLHCPDHPTYVPPVSRYLTNSFEISEKGSGVFVKAARINHSCTPNAFFTWNKNIKRVAVHAMIDIPAGREVTVSYVYPFLSRNTRKHLLQKLYVFECDCPACLETPSGQLSEQRRLKMEALYIEIDKCDGTSENDQHEFKMVIDFIELAEEEGIDGEFLSRMYRRAKDCFLDKGLTAPALRYADMEVQSDARLLGEDHEATQESLNLREELEIEAGVRKPTQERPGV